MAQQSVEDSNFFVYYSSLYQNPNGKENEKMWVSPETIKIYDETTDKRYFQKEYLYFTVSSAASITLKVSMKFYKLDLEKIQSWKAKKKMDVFQAFKERMGDEIKP